MASMWDTLVQTVKPHFLNMAHNAYQGVADAASAAGHAIAHPVETAEAIPAAAKHAYQKIDQFAGGAGQAAVHALGLPQTGNTLGDGSPDQNASDEQSFHGTVNEYKKNYGSWKGFTQHLENHPWQVLNDALMVAGPAEAIAGRLGEAAKVGKVAATADDLDEAFGHTPTGQRQSLVSPTSGVEPSGSVKPISADHLDRIFGHADAAPEATPEAPNDNTPTAAPTGQIDYNQLSPEDLNNLPPANREYVQQQTAEPIAPKPDVQNSAERYQGTPGDFAPANDPSVNEGGAFYTPGEADRLQARQAAQTGDHISEVPQDGPRVINSFGNFVEHPVPDDELPGTHVFSYTADNGEVIPHIRMGIEPNGMAEMSIDPFATAKNRIGPAEMRKAMGQLMDQYPEIKGFGGFRRSGAGAGRVQEVTPPSRNILSDQSGKFNPWGGKEYEDDEVGPVSTPFTQKIAQALIDAQPVRENQDAMVSRVRGERFNNFSQRLGMAQTADDYARSLSALSGEMPKNVYPSIRGQFTDDELKNMYQMIGDNPRLSPGSKATAIRGLNKMVSSEGENFGMVPQPSELKVLKQVFPKEVTDALEAKQGTDWREVLSNIAGIPMTLMTTGDISSPFRHAGFFATRPEFWKAMPKMLGDISSPNFYERQMNSIAADPNFENMEKAGVDFTGVSRDTPLTEHEEGFQSNLVQRVPGLGGLVKASERGYTGFLNRVRADVFNTMYYKMQEAGMNFSENPKALTDLGKLVNVGTGRGNLGNLGPVTANTLFAPKLLGAKLTQLNPLFYYRLDPMVRAEALKSLAGYIGLAGGAMYLAHINGKGGSFNPLDDGFGKIVDGNVHMDLTGGTGTVIKLYAKVAKFLYDEGSAVAKGESALHNPKGKTAFNDLVDFARSKTGPVTSMGIDVLDGKTYDHTPTSESDPLATKIFGKDVPFSSEVIEHFTPMVMSDMRKVYAEQGKEGLAKYFLPDMLGLQTSAYKPKASSSKGSFNVDDMDKAFEKYSEAPNVDDIDKIAGY